MDLFKIEDPKYEYMLNMPLEVLPPESAYRFKPDRKDRLMRSSERRFFRHRPNYFRRRRPVFQRRDHRTPKLLQVHQGEKAPITQIRVSALLSGRDMAFLLRFLQSTKFNNEAALKGITDYDNWRNTTFPMKIDTKLAEFIVSRCLTSRTPGSSRSSAATETTTPS